MDQKQPFEGHLPSPVVDLTNSTALYHIYHTGPYSNYYSIHTESDSNTPLNRFPKRLSGTEIQTESTNSLFSFRRTETTSPKKVSKSKALDNPRCDPRTETSPYFLHLPTIYGKAPPYTLRHGGTKAAPTTCLLHCSSFWRTWKLEFGDILAQPGVVDGRGVVNIKYGTKNGIGGTFQGYEVRPKRYVGESGKAWHKLQATQGEKVVELAEKPKPEEIVCLKWTAPLSFHTREYRFTWRGFEFIWKGTQTVRSSKKFFHPFLRYNNLKLVVLIPGQEGEQAKELILAGYASVVAGRKSGRLEVYQHVIDDFLSEHAAALQQYGLTTNVVSDGALQQEKYLTVQDREPESSAKTTRRLADLVVGTAMCMIIGEFTKRQVLIGVILALLGAYDG
ncbi:hypothetical protein BKA65DRAFT_402523 [Rhexocercosporidium sp. MPI-PUGE-AT-0058]|nr:hypothetical protein BKA65DRAFT_402523 [Rhexocercosporidium sp. MPI-PUGE-AT-0058]